MIIKSLEDLQVYQLALQAADAISAILERPALRRDFELRSQMADCSASVGARISEGFGQGTDRHCAHYQHIARGAANEMLNHLSVAAGRRYVTKEEEQALAAKYVEIGKKLTRWIQHLKRENRSDRR